MNQQILGMALVCFADENILLGAYVLALAVSPLANLGFDTGAPIVAAAEAAGAGPFVSPMLGWAATIASQLLAANGLGVALGEWRGAPRGCGWLIAAGIAVALAAGSSTSARSIHPIGRSILGG